MNCQESFDSLRSQSLESGSSAATAYPPVLDAIFPPYGETEAITCASTVDRETRRAIALGLISFLALFFELAFIRWLPANVLSLAYFSNVVLISSFLGLGLGCLISERRDLFRWYPPLLLILVLVYLFFRQFEVVTPDLNSEWIWSSYRGNKLEDVPLSLGILPTLTLVFTLNAMFFVPIGQKMGALMGRFPPILGYSINILGSLLGVAAFAALSFVGRDWNSPALWFGLSSFLSLWFFLDDKKWLLASLLMLGGVTFLMGYTSRDDLWSPYYSIQLRDGDGRSKMLYVNRFFHQKAIDFEATPEAMVKYSLPYRVTVPKNVLILGAGTGNDAAVAAANNIPDIDAVEIDPAIADLGRHIHPSRPYDRENVHVIVNDARSYLRTTNKKYDMIIFGTLDSHALLSGMSTVRLDNYVYTAESLRDARRCLSENGIVVLMFSVPVEWIGQKLIAMSQAAFPEPKPLVFVGDSFLFNLMILAGPGVKPEMTDFSEGLLKPLGNPKVSDSVTVPTDNWPYLYLQNKAIPLHYRQAGMILAAISIAAVGVVAFGQKTSRGKIGLSELNFFALGCAFLLLETKCVTTLSLVFGSTWLVNAFVFGAILTMILLANLFVLKVPIRRIVNVYLLLAASLVLNYFVPVSSFLFLSYWTRALLSAVWVALPLFFAAILFAYHFKQVGQIGFAFGANLIGAVLGGLLEYSSMAMGLNALYLVAGCFYFVSYLSSSSPLAAGRNNRGKRLMRRSGDGHEVRLSKRR